MSRASRPLRRGLFRSPSAGLAWVLRVLIAAAVLESAPLGPVLKRLIQGRGSTGSSVLSALVRLAVGQP